ncbi:MAG: SDR family NAD(P)-dependent oxidoreductase [Spongiibacteraceae bacterium]|jgi:NAD(P)-dependent dehydrogenase (short-subunit alcohol dehydrogenase family)|nr:SDR family NAD(P)-dependent oxidoreductase [Spongiibacteraceae bacterium]
MTELKDEVAIVTGAGRGLGRAIAMDLAAAGATVGLVARSAGQLEEVAEAIRAAGGQALALPLDVTDRTAVEAAVAQMAEAFGPVTLLVNNAGVDRPYGPVHVADPDEWWRAQEIHVRGALLFMHAVLPAMRERRHGRIINMASAAAVVVGPNTSAYCVAKATLLRLTEHVDQENKDAGLSAFCIHPGTIMTDMAAASLSDPAALQYAGHIIGFLSQFKDVDPEPELARLGAQCVALASGAYDSLSGRYLDLEKSLDELVAELPGEEAEAAMTR